jgi:hypothetical protein
LYDKHTDQYAHQNKTNQPNTTPTSASKANAQPTNQPTNSATPNATKAPPHKSQAQPPNQLPPTKPPATNNPQNKTMKFTTATIALSVLGASVSQITEIHVASGIAFDNIHKDTNLLEPIEIC